MRPENSEHVIRENSLLDPVVEAPPKPSNEHLFEMDVTAQRVEIPAEITTYWCQVMQLDKRLIWRKHHAIEYAPIITPGNEHIVHHMEIFHCREHPGEVNLDVLPSAYRLFYRSTEDSVTAMRSHPRRNRVQKCWPHGQWAQK